MSSWSKLLIKLLLLHLVGCLYYCIVIKFLEFCYQAVDIFLEITTQCHSDTSMYCNTVNHSHIKGQCSNSNRPTAVCHKVPQLCIAIHFLFKVCYLIVLSSGKMIDEWMCMEHRLNYTGRKSYCHFAHHKSHMNWPGIEPRPLQREVGNALCEPRRGPPVHLVPARRHNKCTLPLTNSP